MRGRINQTEISGSRQGREIDLKNFFWYPPELVQTPVKITTASAKGMMSIPSITLMLAGIDISRDLYGKWVLGAEIFLEIYYERVPGSFKITRMDPSPTRSIHITSEVLEYIKNFGSFLWVPEKGRVKLIPADNWAVLDEQCGTANFNKYLDGKRERVDLRLPLQLFEEERCIVAISTTCIVLIPNNIYGVKVMKDCGVLRVDMRPVLKSARKDFKRRFEGYWSCWRGRATIHIRNGVLADRKCLILFKTQCP